MSERRSLAFTCEDEVIADLGWLRRGYRQVGEWNLPQVCWHLSSLIEKYLEPPADPSAKPTAEQAERQAWFFAKADKPRGFDGMTCPPPFIPPVESGDVDIERFIAELRKLKAYPQEMVQMGPIGPAPIAQCRKAHVAHAAHHLSFLIPQAPPRRVGLVFNSVDDVIADVQKLRKGWEQTAGQWTLPQICWHLEIAMRTSMTPVQNPVETPEQTANKPRLQALLAAGKITGFIPAPERAVPPADAGDAAIDAFLATLEKYKTFPGPFAPHRLFGKMTDDEARRIALIHCAHHLSYLAPKGG
jgi:hypothetical protein